MPSAESVPGSDLPPGVRLIPAERIDSRTDEEILAWLQEPHPVTSEKNVWAFWHSGLTNAPPWVQRCIIGWVRRLGPEWTVHVLDHVRGSKTDVSHYVEPSFFPEAFNNYTMNGLNSGAHQADLARLPLLLKYGGVWLDAGTYLFRHLDDICWREIEDPDSPYELGGFHFHVRPDADCILNGFIAAKRNNPFIKRWHAVYLAIWGTAADATDFHKHPLIRHLPLMTPIDLDPEKPGENHLVTAGQFTDYLAQVMAFERTRKLVDPSDGFNGPEYLRDRAFLVPALKESLWIQLATLWNHDRQYAMLMKQRAGKGAVRDELWHEADRMAADILAGSATMKLCHGGGSLVRTVAGTWDEEEHWHDDIAEGTFAAFLRYGSLRFEQTRKLVPLKIELTKEEVLYAGILEPKKMDVEEGECESP
ncbi:hypothetical protein ESCO_005736 [Escovopsis weberi]|uniref:Capsule polysaccharide biosynthesis protein n=1 Tax=Escovopsis weberi TaxID=150374 RepID=A0A0N0RTI5_ESCWE|nr:hypothetical protein ESCO_005736 [Escovopsis weberi]